MIELEGFEQSQWIRFNFVPSHQIRDANVGCKKGKAMTDPTYNVMMPDKGVPIKAWTKGVPLEDAARQRLLYPASAGASSGLLGSYSWSE